MTTALVEVPFSFTLPPENEAHEPPELRGRRRDAVRLLVSRGEDEPLDASFGDLGAFLAPGDVVVVNTSATVNAAFAAHLPDGRALVLHHSGILPGGLHLVEPRLPDGPSTRPLTLDAPLTVALAGGASVSLLTPFGDSRRLWLAAVPGAGEWARYAAAHGHPISYRHAPGPFPLAAYQTIFGRESGSAEMPSAGRPFSHELVTDLVARGIGVVPILLHTGVSSLEGAERPYPEYFRVSASAASALNSARRRGARVLAVGTTVVRALASVTDERAVVHPGEGFSEALVTAEHPVASLDGLLTGWHEPASTHLLLLESVLSRPALGAAYRHAIAAGYRWHEFGDSHLLLPDGASR
ncbi:MAG TPA: S-adenosylmethionine:tRNA ribosyltransferase-isomerase [Acidimicrobiales bacterium]|nr:S-adenosylmethionine:tRNA ribosyltransferase-isomerase [Acidimicrobiales bacterium]